MLSEGVSSSDQTQQQLERLPPPLPIPTLFVQPRVELSSSQQIELEEIKSQVQELQQSTDPEAKGRLKALWKRYYDAYSRAQRETVLPLENQIRNLKSKYDEENQLISSQISELEPVINGLNSSFEKILELKGKNPSSAVIKRQIREAEEGSLLVPSLPERIRKLKQQKETLETEKHRQTELYRQTDRRLKQERDEAKRRIAPLKVLSDAIPQQGFGITSRREQTSQPSTSQRTSFSIEPLFASFLEGLYLENIKRFILKADQVEAMDETLTIPFLVQKYNEFIKRDPNFDERIIVAIATGYLYKDTFHKNDLTPLSGSKTEPELKDEFEEAMVKLYQLFPNLQETAQIKVNPRSAQEGLGQVESFLTEQVSRANVQMRTTQTSVTPPRQESSQISVQMPRLRSTQPVISEERPMREQPQLRPSLAHIEEQREQLERQHQQANRDFVNPLRRLQPNPDHTQVAELHDRLTSGNFGTLEAVGLQDLNRRLEEGSLSTEAIVALNSLNQQLQLMSQSHVFEGITIREDLNYVEIIKATTIALEKVKQRIEETTTPLSILRESKDRTAGFLNAIKRYKETHQGNNPSIVEMNQWLDGASIKGNDRRQLQQLMKKL